MTATQNGAAHRQRLCKLPSTHCSSCRTTVGGRARWRSLGTATADTPGDAEREYALENMAKRGSEGNISGSTRNGPCRARCGTGGRCIRANSSSGGSDDTSQQDALNTKSERSTHPSCRAGLPRWRGKRAARIRQASHVTVGLAQELRVSSAPPGGRMQGRLTPGAGASLMPGRPRWVYGSPLTPGWSRWA